MIIIDETYVNSTPIANDSTPTDLGMSAEEIDDLLERRSLVDPYDSEQCTDNTYIPFN